jgi:uncharacterized damage-inducible protein DinB
LFVNAGYNNGLKVTTRTGDESNDQKEHHMSKALIDITLQQMDFNRERTLGTLATIEKLPDPAKALGWRPGPGRAHIAWQVMHLGITEELFATERFLGTPPAFADLIPRFKGGSTPDDDIPSLASIRDVLAQSRAHLQKTILQLTEADLANIPPALKERGISIGKALSIIAWHEAHHQGQAHITLNLFKAAGA